MASFVAAYRVGMLVSTAGALFSSAASRARVCQERRLDGGLSGDGRLVLVGIVTTLIATEPEKSAAAVADHAAHQRDNPLHAWRAPPCGAFADFLSREMAIVVLLS